MALFARNQLPGQIKDVKLRNTMAHVIIQVGDHEVESVIPRRVAEDMDLKIGDGVTVFIRSTDVMIRKKGWDQRR